MSEEILLVDDDPKILEIIGESLGRKGYTVSTASNGRQALNAYANRPPALVVLDMLLPDMNGVELMDKLHTECDCDAPVVVLSADGDINTRLRLLDHGAEDYLVKPVSLRELDMKIRHVLKRDFKARASERHRETLRSELEQEHEHFSNVTREFKRQLLSMRTLFGVSQDLNRVVDTDELSNVVSLTLLGELQIASMAMFSLDRENAGEFSLVGIKGFAREKFERLLIKRRSQFVRMLEIDGKPRKIARTVDRRWTRLLPDLRLAAFEYVTPIIIKGEAKGLIFTGPKIRGGEYTEYDIDMMTFISNSAGIGMENKRLLKQLQVTYVNTLKTLVSVLEAKDAYTRGHTERVASYAVAIATRLGLDEEHSRRVMFGALLHDIGKLGVMDSVVHKKGALDAEEWELLKAHPAIGAEIVEKMEFLDGVADTVRYHHESWDGRGYPEGLSGTDIPLGARIVAVADSFDAMTTDRSYRRALSVEQALGRLEAAAGTQFDADVVRVFNRYIRGKGSELVLAAQPGDED